jgi:TonB-dependent receptor
MAGVFRFALIGPQLAWMIWAGGAEAALPRGEPSSERPLLTYHIASQAMDQALVALAARGDRNIVFTPQVVAGKRSRAVIGAFTFEAALALMIRAEGLKALYQPDGSILIVPDARQVEAETRGPQLRRRTATPPETGPVAAVAPVVVIRSAAALDPQARGEIMTLEEIGRAPDRNVAEAVGREPGVTVLDGGPGATNSVGVDLPGRGSGNYISLRGFDAPFDRIQIDGVDVAQSQPYGRGVQLNLLPTIGLQRIVIDKSLSADQDGDAIGGVLDFRTPTGFDFATPFHVSLGAGVQAEEAAARYGRDPFGNALFADLAARSGPGGAFGLHLGLYSDREHFSNGVVDGIYPAEFNGAFTYALATPAGASAPGLDPSRNLVLTGLDIGVTTGEVKRQGGDVSLDWRPDGEAAAHARLTWARATTEQASAYAQIYGDDITSGAAGPNGLVAPVIGAVRPRYYWETNPETSELGTAQIGAESRVGPFHATGTLFLTWGETNDPNHFEISAREPELGPALPFGGSRLFTDVGGLPVPNLSPTALATIADIADYGARRAGEVTQEFSRQLAYGVGSDLTWRRDGDGLSSLAFGFKFSNALRQHTVRDYSAPLLFTTDANDPTIGSLGLFSGTVKAPAPNLYRFTLPLIRPAAVYAFFDANVAAAYGGLAGASDQCGALPVNTYNCDTQRGGEAVVALYALSRFHIAGLEIETGLRFEHTRVSNQFWVLPQTPDGAEAPGHFASTTTTYDKPLPRVSAAWRPDSATVLRAAAWASYVRPAPFQLGGGTQIVNTGGGAANGGVTTVTEGNPHLKAVDAINLDLAIERTSPRRGDVSAAVFYKAIDHYSFDTVNAYSNAPGTNIGGEVVNQPRNGGAGRLYGLEVAARRPLFPTSPTLRGVAVAGNATWTHSAVDTGLAGLSRQERLLNQPDLQTNLRLSWARGGGAVDLAYRWIGPYVAQYATLGSSSALDTWVRASRRLDLTASYRAPFGLRIGASVANLLDDRSYDATIGAHTATIPSVVFSSRTYQLQTRVIY